MSNVYERPSTPHLVRDALRQAMALVATEISLAKLEASEKLTLALMSIVSLIAAAVFVVVALIFLLQGLVYLLIHYGFAPFAASFIVGGGIAFIALLAVLVTVRNLSSARLAPRRTIGQLEVAKDLVVRSAT